jgi:diketogulonate reductase-like aldo/keto reductase
LTPLVETPAALDDIARQGKARYVGVSNFRLGRIEEAIRLRRVDVCNTRGTCSARWWNRRRALSDGRFA